MKHIHPAQLDQEGIKKLIGDAESVIQRVLEKEPAKLYAPAYGEVNEKIVAAAAESGYRTIMWSADTIDWQKPAPAVIVQRVQRKIAPGGIVLMHPTENTVKALPEMLKMLAEKTFSQSQSESCLKPKLLLNHLPQALVFKAQTPQGNAADSPAGYQIHFCCEAGAVFIPDSMALAS